MLSSSRPKRAFRVVGRRGRLRGGWKHAFVNGGCRPRSHTYSPRGLQMALFRLLAPTDLALSLSFFRDLTSCLTTAGQDRMSAPRASSERPWLLEIALVRVMFRGDSHATRFEVARVPESNLCKQGPHAGWRGRDPLQTRCAYPS